MLSVCHLNVFFLLPQILPYLSRRSAFFYQCLFRFPTYTLENLAEENVPSGTIRVSIKNNVFSNKNMQD